MSYFKAKMHQILGLPQTVTGTFAPRNFRPGSESSIGWNLRSLELSHPKVKRQLRMTLSARLNGVVIR